MKAVLASRDAIDPKLEKELLEAIVDAEADSLGDGATAMQAIDRAVSAAIGRGVGVADAEGSMQDDVDGSAEEAGSEG